ncbi:MAG TPA: hypothetical protein VHY79_02400 [Rhizomicrobium sp.]|jgi:hypothetical protein|nr:hypothetical protein [Rhizomicrobium sp.]
MNNLTKRLLAGSAICALATAAAIAGNVPHFSITALHAGHVVNKTRAHTPGRQNLTYTFSVSTYIPASDLHKTVKLPDVYKFNSYSTICSSPKQKIKVVPKKTQYAKIGTYTETYSEGCSSGPTLFYGDTYKLTNPAGEGHNDYFVSSLIGRFKNSHGKYKGTLNLDFTVSIGN